MNKDIKSSWMPSKKTWIAVGSIVVILLVLWFVLSQGILGSGIGKNVEFKNVAKDSIPKPIETEVIPEYRELERALGCLVDGKVYVLVTRGEKPTSGYKVSIEKMTMESKDGKSNLKVEALFSEPETGVAQSKVTTYPCAVALTKLTVLPDSIELIAKY